jgi:hypothetical protein
MHTDTTTHAPARPGDPMRGAALAAGLLYLATFAFSIPALGLYDTALNDPAYVLGAGDADGVLWGGLIEIITGLTGIGTAVALYPVVRRYSGARAVAFVTSRTLEAAMIFAGVVAILAVYTLRQDAAGADPDALTTTARGLVAVKDWTFMAGPGIMPAINALFLATVLYKSRLVPRIIPALGIVGAPILLLSATGMLFGAWEQISGPAILLALPIATWEFSLGVYLTVKGFRTPPVPATPTPVHQPEPALVGASA